MKTLASSLLASISFLLLLPGAKGGCVNDEVIIGDDGPQVCTAMGCADMVTVAFDRALNEPYDVSLSVDGQPASGACNPTGASPFLSVLDGQILVTCRTDGLQIEGAPGTLRVTVSTAELAGSVEGAPPYQPVYPNGPACDVMPVCQQATMALSLTDGGGCFVGGCSGQLCTDDPNAGSTCEWLEEYACYQSLGVCERGTDGTCGWRDTPELNECITNAQTREPIVGQQCVRNAGDTCVTDADCMVGGCGNELCFNPAQSEGASTCDCGPPQVTGCGCVGGQCTWYD